MVGNLKKEIGLSIGIILGSVVVFGVVLYYGSVRLATETTTLVVERNVRARQAGAAGRLAKLEQQSREAVRYTDELRALLPTEEELIAFRRWLEQTASARDVRVNLTFRSDPVPPTDGAPGFLRFAIDAGGTLEDITGFLRDIETTSHFLINIETLGISRATSEYGFAAQGKVYFR